MTSVRSKRTAYWRERYRTNLVVRLQARVRYLESVLAQLRLERDRWNARRRWAARTQAQITAERERVRRNARTYRERHRAELRARRIRYYWMRKCGQPMPRSA